MGVPNGGGATHTYNKGTIVHLPDDEYGLLEGRRMRDGTRWIEVTDMKVRSVKLEPKMYRCKVCFNKYKYKHGLKRHLLTHGKIKPYKCIMCGATFETPQGLAGHSNVHSSGLKYSRTDPVTGRKIERKVWPNRTSVVGFYCEHSGCGKSFTTKQGFGVHRSRAHGSEDANPGL